MSLYKGQPVIWKTHSAHKKEGGPILQLRFLLSWGQEAGPDPPGWRGARSQQAAASRAQVRGQGHTQSCREGSSDLRERAAEEMGTAQLDKR